MTRLKSILKSVITPVIQKQWLADAFLAIPRISCGLWLTAVFGADKFGMPWTADSQNLNLFEVSAWFPEDVANYGGIFSSAPVFFAWMGAFSEAVGGLFLLLGLKTRLAAFLIICTMLVAIFMQKWNEGLWAMLPAIGFLWVAIYSLILGSGRFGLDYLINKTLK
ncbi:putative oxidoreductase [Formosa sp. Hel1_31_208]|uniref:DoxX family protein n=1 Tax=Formosa sp. Hel1_31_208 TaxID=1798225 RepID=UPI00087AB0A7|nr:DoxX family protein [Formosa sp. Hel1_31_208]SDS21445.1 putative oxidoreductase [Formosa sp. Hel1_31_208]